MAALPPGVPRLAFVETPWGGGVAGRVVYDEFGFASSTRPWVLGPAVDLVLREQGRLTPTTPAPIVDVYSPDATVLPTNEPVIDLRAALQRLR